ncbi:class I SAM-dependent methyltransferase [Segetibacter koreensis]|uniref:class I SAM-dependent methyltransferase n=1 Tax=Segetibacter koreensis TaxID=398037 RepID=UPI00146E30C9|nr:class I SAM-dependent methyltransferase [Segetibacter koreensis]
MIDESTTHDKILNNPFTSGKLFPYNMDTTDYIVEYQGSEKVPGGNIPVPPIEYWEGYAETEENYIECGKKDIGTILNILSNANESAETLTKVLDLGCAAGRMLRHYPQVPGKSELWGCDINSKYMIWCQQNFDLPFYFFTNSTSPHLPFEDNTLDLVYCGSVFTHITDTADAWLLEIRRIIRKGGYAYITIHDQQTVELIFTKYKDDPLFYDFVTAVGDFYQKADVATHNYAYFSIFADPASQVFYNRDYLVNKWSKFLEIVSITPAAHDHQTAIPLRKR